MTIRLILQPTLRYLPQAAFRPATALAAASFTTRCATVATTRLSHSPALSSPPLARRYISTRSVDQQAAPANKATHLTQDLEDSSAVIPGREGKHPADFNTVAESINQSKTAIQEGNFDLAEPHHGDWTMMHPVYTEDQLNAVQVVYRQPEVFSDKVAAFLVQALRKGFDIVSLYKHQPLPEGHEKMSLEELRKRGCYMTEDMWLHRILFLETTAAIPGMVAGLLRHLHSLRLMRRDGGWIHTLLEEAENERMHLLSFLEIKKPSPLFRLLVLGAQGVFYNMFFITYLLSPRIAHRFVGCLEEEAVVTYTRCIKEIEEGRLPLWADMPAPEIAISYWRLEPDAKMIDFVRAVRADESTHRFVNHTLANLSPTDMNPFAMAEPDAATRGTVPGYSRLEAAQFAHLTREKMAQEGQPKSHDSSQ